jgi:hypothetical protein
MTLLGIITALTTFLIIGHLTVKVRERLDKSYLKRADNKRLDQFLEHHRVY